MAEVRTQAISYPGGTGSARGYLAESDDGATHPGLIVIQEWWGIDGHIEDVTRRFAREGFVALSPDLYHGKVTTDPAEAKQLSQSLSLDDGAADIQAAIDYLKASPRVSPKKVGVIGFCMGGSFTLEIATRSRDLAAVAPFYGSRTGQFIDRADELGVPMFAAFGAEDTGIPVDVAERFRAALQRAGKPAEVRIYPGAGHAFVNDQRPSFRADAAKDAWERAVALFREHLR